MPRGASSSAGSTRVGRTPSVASTVLSQGNQPGVVAVGGMKPTHALSGRALIADLEERETQLRQQAQSRRPEATFATFLAFVDELNTLTGQQVSDDHWEVARVISARAELLSRNSLRSALTSSRRHGTDEDWFSLLTHVSVTPDVFDQFERQRASIHSQSLQNIAYVCKSLGEFEDARQALLEYINLSSEVRPQTLLNLVSIVGSIPERGNETLSLCAEAVGILQSDFAMLCHPALSGVLVNGSYAERREYERHRVFVATMIGTAVMHELAELERRCRGANTFNAMHPAQRALLVNYIILRYNHVLTFVNAELPEGHETIARCAAVVEDFSNWLAESPYGSPNDRHMAELETRWRHQLRRAKQFDLLYGVRCLGDEAANDTSALMVTDEALAESMSSIPRGLGRSHCPALHTLLRRGGGHHFGASLLLSAARLEYRWDSEQAAFQQLTTRAAANCSTADDDDLTEFSPIRPGERVPTPQLSVPRHRNGGPQHFDLADDGDSTDAYDDELDGVVVAPHHRNVQPPVAAAVFNIHPQHHREVEHNHVPSSGAPSGIVLCPAPVSGLHAVRKQSPPRATVSPPSAPIRLQWRSDILTGRWQMPPPPILSRSASARSVSGGCSPPIPGGVPPATPHLTATLLQLPNSSNATAGGPTRSISESSAQSRGGLRTHSPSAPLGEHSTHDVGPRRPKGPRRDAAAALDTHPAPRPSLHPR